MVRPQKMVETYIQMLCKCSLLGCRAGVRIGISETERSLVFTADSTCFVPHCHHELMCLLFCCPCRGHCQVGKGSAFIFTLTVLWRKYDLPLQSTWSSSAPICKEHCQQPTEQRQQFESWSVSLISWWAYREPECVHAQYCLINM